IQDGSTGGNFPHPGTRSLSDLTLIYCGKAGFGHIFRSFSLNSGAIRLKSAKNLPQTGFTSLRSVKSDRLLAQKNVTLLLPPSSIPALPSL
ncbi:MAG TPA: hypothetical protein VJN01_03960, partial [Xanthomonadales bacterium]|nr:hypothetical protein [Xanthomonadales bacterium]